MRSPADYVFQRVGGFKIREVARRCVPCYKYVIEDGRGVGGGQASPSTAARGEAPPYVGQRLGLCMLIDHFKLYRFPHEDADALFGIAREAVGMRGLELKARFLRGEMEHLRLREFQPGICRYVKSAVTADVS
jgi:hypothetical protein